MKLMTHPIPKEAGMVNFTVVRKGMKLTKIMTKYYLYDANKSIFMANAKKQFGNKNSNFHITAMKNKFDKKKR
jgi:hypothetical protein